MTHYATLDAQQFARILTHGARLACLALTDSWKTAKEGRFQHNGAQFLHWQYRDFEGAPLICEKQPSGDSTLRAGKIQAYRLTPLGLKVKHELQLMKS